MTRSLTPPPLHLRWPADTGSAATATLGALCVVSILTFWGVLKAGESIAATPQGAQWLQAMAPGVVGSGWREGLPWGAEAAWALCSLWAFGDWGVGPARWMSAALILMFWAGLAIWVWRISLAHVPPCEVVWNGQQWRVALGGGDGQAVDLQLCLDLWSGLVLRWRTTEGPSPGPWRWRWVRSSQCDEAAWQALRWALQMPPADRPQDFSV